MVSFTLHLTCELASAHVCRWKHAPRDALGDFIPGRAPRPGRSAFLQSPGAHAAAPTLTPRAGAADPRVALSTCAGLWHTALPQLLRRDALSAAVDLLQAGPGS